MKGKETRYAQDDRSQNLVPDIKVVVGEAAPLVRQDAIVWVLCRKLRNADPEGAALLHALEDEVDSVSLLLLQTV